VICRLFFGYKAKRRRMEDGGWRMGGGSVEEKHGREGAKKEADESTSTTTG
jgi:hypothetical protein